MMNLILTLSITSNVIMLTFVILVTPLFIVMQSVAMLIVVGQSAAAPRTQTLLLERLATMTQAAKFKKNSKCQFSFQTAELN